jgi:hypothetical protein
MQHWLATGALASLLAVGAAAEAAAWTSHGTVSTRRGDYAIDGSGSCGARACSFSHTVTGPNGGSVTGNGAVVRTGPYRYTYWGRSVGPHGGTVVRAGNVFVAPRY